MLKRLCFLCFLLGVWLQSEVHFGKVLRIFYIYVEIRVCSKTSRATVPFIFKHINLLGSTHLLILTHEHFAYAVPFIFEYVMYCEVQLLALHECFFLLHWQVVWIRIRMDSRQIER